MSRMIVRGLQPHTRGSGRRIDCRYYGLLLVRHSLKALPELPYHRLAHLFLRLRTARVEIDNNETLVGFIPDRTYCPAPALIDCVEIQNHATGVVYLVTSRR